MTPIIRFFDDNAPIIFFIILVSLIIIIRRIWITWREGRDDIFGLEREMSTRRMTQAVTILVILLVLGVAQIIISFFIVPTLPAVEMLSTPQVDPLLAQSGTLPVVAGTIVVDPTNPLVFDSSGCIPEQIMITYPETGQTVSGQVQLIGTANIPDFGFYKYEIAVSGTENWTTIQAGRERKIEEELGLWDTTELIPGDYLLRLVVINNEGEDLAPCVIPIRVIGE